MSVTWKTLTHASITLFGLIGTGCANDPLYIPSAMQLEAGMDDGMGGVIAEARSVLSLPVEVETVDDAAARGMRAAALMVEVPYVKVGDIEVSVEWTIRNLDVMNPGNAKIQLNGANEFFRYDPLLLMTDSDDEEAPPPPGLDGDVPIHIPAGGSFSGVFREDQIREASIDLDQITRGNVNPFAAVLKVSKNAVSFQPMTAPMPDDEDYVQVPVGLPIPREAFAQMIEIDLVFKPDRHMVLEYTVRVRDVRGIMHDLLDAAVTQAPGELTTFAPADYAP